MSEVHSASAERSPAFKFDLYHDARLRGDLHASLKTLHRDAPDVFYTPDNGGHWVVTRTDLMEEVLKDYDRFSSSCIRVPRVDEAMVLIPLNLDPPQHTGYRRMLSGYFGPAMIKRMEPAVRGWASKLVDDVADRGACDFSDAVGTLFPVSVFMELMGLPLERLREYRALVVEYFDDVTPERRIELEHAISAEMRQVLDARKLEPRDDLASKLLQEQANGAAISDSELEQLCNLLFQAGMDTVANFAAFLFLYLGTKPELQREIREHPERIADVVEEGFRMFGVVNAGREAKRDTTLGDVQIRAGDILICMLPLAGLDERRNPSPEDFELDRKRRSHLLFSQGVHLCVGHQLARLEMRILLEEWFKRIPEFRIGDNFAPPFRAGPVMGLATLPLRWTPISAR